MPVHDIVKRDVLFRREISLNVICEKVKFSNFDFWNNFRDFYSETYLMIFEPRAKEITMA